MGYGYAGFYWLAENPQADERVALKIYDRNAFEDRQWAMQWMREIRRASRFGHPNIVGVVNAGRYDERFVVAMEFVKGVSLRELLTSGRRFAARAAASMAVDLLKALTCLAEQSYCHGDIQPAAVMALRTGEAKLSDFGLRMALPAFGPGARFKATRGIEYLRYYAPEQFDAGAVLDSRTDLYGVGAVLYHLLCNRPPFGATTARELVSRIRAVMPIPPSMISDGLAPAFNYMISRAMAKDRSQRYESPGEFRADLEEILDEPEA